MTEPAPEVSKYAESLLFLTPEPQGNFAIRCHMDQKKKYWYSVREFIGNVHRDILSPEACEDFFVRVYLEVPHDQVHLKTIEIQFLGPYEKPISCLHMQGLSIVYHYMEKNNLLLESKKAEFSKVIHDCLEGREAKHVKLVDDDQVKMHEQEYSLAIDKGEAFDGNPPNESVAVFNPVLLLNERNESGAALTTLKEVVEKKEQEFNTENKRIKDKANEIITRLKRQLSEKDEQLTEKTELLSKKNEQLESLMQTQQDLEEELEAVKTEPESRKQKGESFNIRQVLDFLGFDLNSADFIKLTKRVMTTLKEQHADTCTFIKNKQVHFYPSERELVQALVSREYQTIKGTAEQRAGDALKLKNIRARVAAKKLQYEGQAHSGKLTGMRDMANGLDYLKECKLQLDEADHVALANRVVARMTQEHPTRKITMRGDEPCFSAADRFTAEIIATEEVIQMVFQMNREMKKKAEQAALTAEGAKC